MIFLEHHTKEEYDLPVDGSDKEIRIKCPICSEDRKKKNQKDLAIKGQVGFCHHCDRKFYKKPDFKVVKDKNYSVPEWNNNTDLSDAVVKRFEERGIKQFTLRAMKITEGKEWMPQFGKDVNTIQFNYFRDDQLVNIKYRGPQKSFKMYKNAELIFYNLDNIKEKETCVIVEGEFDALAYFEVGIHNVVSVPNGANKKQQNLEYLDNCIEYFADKSTIYIATDQDKPGHALKKELVRRFGFARCKNVSFKDVKDANEYLLKYGRDALVKTIEDATEFKIEGVFQIKDFIDDHNRLYEYGIEKGLEVRHQNLNECVTWETGRLLTVTGIPGMGKSEFVDELVTDLNLLHNWKIAYFSPENFPVEFHTAKLTERLIGKRFRKSEMTPGEKDLAVDYIHDNFFWINPEDENYTIDTILQRASDLVYRYGIKCVVLDPWNRIEHQGEKGESETKYIGRVLTKIVNFAQKNDLLFILVAHPTKMQKANDGFYEVPNLYSISGSANFFNQTDYGITVYIRNKKMDGYEHVEIHVQKVKFKYLGETGVATFMYNKVNGRFMPCQVIKGDDGFNKPMEGSWMEDNNTYIGVGKEVDFWHDMNEIEPEF